MNNKQVRVVAGFTLIELLVVVLIIGILAAVALPQYQLAVGKTRLINLVATTRKIREAQEFYYSQHGIYTNKWENLDINWPGSLRHDLNILTTSDGKQFSLTLGSTTSTASVAATDKSLPDILITTSYNNSGLGKEYDNNVVCYVKRTNELAVNICRNVAEFCRIFDATTLKCYLQVH